MKWFCLVLLLLQACIHPGVKYQKAQLLDPAMDPQKTSGLSAGMGDGVIINTPERAQIGASGVTSTTCPTCGG